MKYNTNLYSDNNSNDFDSKKKTEEMTETRCGCISKIMATWNLIDYVNIIFTTEINYLFQNPYCSQTATTTS